MGGGFCFVYHNYYWNNKENFAVAVEYHMRFTNNQGFFSAAKLTAEQIFTENWNRQRSYTICLGLYIDVPFFLCMFKIASAIVTVPFCFWLESCVMSCLKFCFSFTQ